MHINNTLIFFLVIDHYSKCSSKTPKNVRQKLLTDMFGVKRQSQEDQEKEETAKRPSRGTTDSDLDLSDCEK